MTLADLVAEHVRPGGGCGVNAHLKVPGLVAGMAAGADSIEDMDLLRHGAMSSLSGGVRAPSTLGSHLRCYAWGNVLQLEKAGREFLAELTRRAPLLPGAGTLAFIDIDSMQKRVYGHKKGNEGATVWAQATPLQLSANDSSARLEVAGCGYLGSAMMVHNPGAVAHTGANGHADCGVTFRQPGGWQITAQLTWQTCWVPRWSTVLRRPAAAPTRSPAPS